MLKTSKAALLAAMLGLSAVPAIGLLPAVAQETKQAEPFTFKIVVPTVLAVDASMTDSDIKDVFTTNFLKHTDALASLNATSITFPEIRAEFTVTESGYSQKTEFIYRDVVLTNVKNGLAESISIGSSENIDVGGVTTSAKSAWLGFDLRRTLEFVGMVKGDPNSGLKAVNASSTSEGTSYKSPLFNCEFGPSTGSSVEARASTVSFADVLAAVGKIIESANADEPPPEAITTLVNYGADLIGGIRGGAATVGPVDCLTAPAAGADVSVKLASIATGDFEPGIYPLITVKGLSVDGGKEGKGSLTDFVLKHIDFNPTINTIKAEAGELNEKWFDDNWRRLIPSFEGLSFSGVDVDAPNPEQPGQRVQLKVANFDLSLADYLNGIPTKVSTTGTGIEIPLPQDTTDPQIATLLAAGLTKVNLGFGLAANWDKASQTIHVDKVQIAGVDLASMSLGATIGNATAQLFDVNENIAMAASLGITVKDLTINVTDDGLGKIVWPIAAAQEGVSDIEAYRTQMAGFAEGLALQVLGSTDAARALGVALGDFVTGKKGELTITISSKEPGGIPLPLFMVAQEDPSVLTGLVDVTATAN